MIFGKEDYLCIFAPDYGDAEYRHKLDEMLSRFGGDSAEFDTIPIDGVLWNILYGKLLTDVLPQLIRLVADEEITNVIAANLQPDFCTILMMEGWILS